MKIKVAKVTDEALTETIRIGTQCAAELTDAQSDLRQMLPDQRIQNMQRSNNEQLAIALELKIYRDKHGPLGESELEAPDLTFIAHRRGIAPR